MKKILLTFFLLTTLITTNVIAENSNLNTSPAAKNTYPFYFSIYNSYDKQSGKFVSYQYSDMQNMDTYYGETNGAIGVNDSSTLTVSMLIRPFIGTTYLPGGSMQLMLKDFYFQNNKANNKANLLINNINRQFDGDFCPSDSLCEYATFSSGADSNTTVYIQGYFPKQKDKTTVSLAPGQSVTLKGAWQSSSSFKIFMGKNPGIPSLD